MNREYIIFMVIGFVLVFAGALVVYKGSDTKFEIRIMTITEKVCNGRRRL